MKKVLINFLILILIHTSVYSQGIFDGAVIDKGISIRIDYGNETIYDYYISKEKYTGSFYSVNASWLRENNKYFVRSKIEYQQPSNIYNNFVKADVSMLSINKDYLYGAKPFEIFSNKSSEIFIGPSFNFFFYFRRQNIAGGGLTKFLNTYSFASLLSASFNIEYYQQLHKIFFFRKGHI